MDMAEHYINDGNMLLYETIYNYSYEARKEELNTASVIEIPDNIADILAEKVIAIAHSPTIAFYYLDENEGIISKTMHTKTQIITTEYLEKLDFIILYELSLLDSGSMGIRYIPLSNNEAHEFFPDCPYTIQNKRDRIIDETLEENE